MTATKEQVLTIATLVVGMDLPSNKKYIEMGFKVGKLFTDGGLPLDMAIQQLEKEGKYTHENLAFIVFGACQWFIEHKRNSGAGEKAIDRQRKANQHIIENFISGKEMGVY